MKQRVLVLAVVAGCTVAGAAWWGAGRLGAREWLVTGRPSSAADTVTPAMAEVELRSRNIAFYEQRARRDPEGAVDRAQLAGLYLQRGRETGSYEDFRRAEQVARASLAIRTARNGKTFLTLSSSLLAQHRFPEALEVARELVLLEPDVPPYRALLGEIELELGDYDAARATFRSLADAHHHLAVAPRLARWAEIIGRPSDARRILRHAREEAVRRSEELPREQVAWFHLRVGDFELRNGRLNAAEAALKSGLIVEPNDYRILGALARLEAVRQRWRKVIKYGERAGASADLATLGLIGDAHAALGDPAAAERFYQMVEQSAKENPEPFNRQWTLFRLDHDRHVPETLELLRREITIRRDVYGYDQLAWALYKQGDYAAAKEAMDSALRMGTQDAVLFFHAGMIDRALGSHASARTHLERALALNPYFHHSYPAVARAALEASNVIAAR
jgi:tetratricopeptide (TPR) repeat protein